LSRFLRFLGQCAFRGSFRKIQAVNHVGGCSCNLVAESSFDRPVELSIDSQTSLAVYFRKTDTISIKRCAPILFFKIATNFYIYHYDNVFSAALEFLTFNRIGKVNICCIKFALTFFFQIRRYWINYATNIIVFVFVERISRTNWPDFEFADSEYRVVESFGEFLLCVL